MKTKANKNTFVCITCMCCYYILIFAMREKETRLKLCIHSQCIDKKNQNKTRKQCNIYGARNGMKSNYRIPSDFSAVVIRNGIYLKQKFCTHFAKVVFFCGMNFIP